ncbi:MAG: hypothetical protein H7Z72_11435 [Bacteroidetes bacterium]|nr:hypothetical protein [Fibrella sp.]
MSVLFCGLSLTSDYRVGTDRRLIIQSSDTVTNRAMLPRFVEQSQH